MKRLYTVTVEFDYAVMAESESDAKSYASDACRDLSIEDHATALRTVNPVPNVKGQFYTNLPDYDDDSLVYGTDEDLPFGEALAAEQERVRSEQIAKMQGNLFPEPEKP